MSKISPFLWFDTEAEAAGELPRVDFEGFQDRDDLALRRRGYRLERQRDDGELSARRAGIHRSERRAAIQVHRGHLVLRQLRDAGRSRHVLGEALQGRRTRAMRLAERLIRLSSWQVKSTILGKMLHDPDPEKSKRVMQAMLKMKKIDIAALKRAYDQRSR